MPSILCPRCQEPFGVDEQTCKRCGIVKGVRFSHVRWWLISTLLILLISVGWVEIFYTSLYGPFDMSFWILVMICAIPLCVSTFLLYKACLSALLRKRGLVTKGRVSEHRKVARNSGDAIYNTLVPVVTFKADITPPLTCHAVVEYSPLEKFPIGTRQDVIYDPYDPQGNCRVGKRPSVLEQVLWIIAIVACPIVWILIFSLPK